ncbi:IclR family transcriptional regulator [Microbacterium testaceum]|uniref:IclR family transcriptional regulator n=1 Tax=Microbacterium testaceum TaxID=2033 RepID=UPI0034424859
MSDPIDADDDAAPQRQGIQSVELAMQVVRALEEGRGPRTLSQLAQACGMSTSKVHRYLVSLIRSGLVSQSQRTGLYDFGPAARRVGIEALRRVDEVALATEYLPSLRDRTTHSVNLAVWGDNGPVLVHWEYGEHALPMNIRIGSTLPLLDSSVGQVFLAYLPEAMTRSAIVDAASAGESAVAAMAHAERIRAAVRERRASVTSGSVMAGLAAVAAPVFAEGSLPLAVSVALPARLADDETVAAIERELHVTTAEITAALGATTDGHIPVTRRG